MKAIYIKKFVRLAHNKRQNLIYSPVFWARFFGSLSIKNTRPYKPEMLKE